MLPSTDDCDDCTPSYLQRRTQAPLAIVFSSLPFLVTFFFVATVVFQKLFPVLSGNVSIKNGNIASPFLQTTFNLRTASSPGRHDKSKTAIERISAFTFSTTLALAAVLVELILCEISNILNPSARSLALKITVILLLLILVVVIPSLEIQSIISGAGFTFLGNGKGRLRLAWIFQAAGFLLWMMGFWWTGQIFLGTHAGEDPTPTQEHLIDACLERVGVFGISLMALLSGFASVSSPWQNFGNRSRPVTESDISRKEVGLQATNDMLASKRSRLRAIERKISDAPSEGFFQKTIGSIRGNSDQTERRSLQMETAGLESMASSLSTSHSILQARLAQQNRSKTMNGRFLIILSSAFSVYCIYRILTTTISSIHRWISPPDQDHAGSDPINKILAVLVKHYDNHLDQDAWTRQISFLLSGVILFASFSSVLQTFHFFARFTPGLLRAAKANLALIVAQVCATYVISATLLLRGMMSGQAVSEGLKGLGGTEMGWVDGWFDRWFLAGVIVTGAGIWVGRKIGDGSDWDDDGDVEMGKRS
ncbi:hypothetical protein MMC09_004426 [Bachmanniomyces sp. S44760]|nr:hypothetical protein [Bachmanniomyces sp. S44760]